MHEKIRPIVLSVPRTQEDEDEAVREARLSIQKANEIPSLKPKLPGVAQTDGQDLKDAEIASPQKELDFGKKKTHARPVITEAMKSDAAKHEEELIKGIPEDDL